MTQLFTDDEPLGDPGVGPASRETVHLVRQRQPADDELGPALSAGKGVRAVRCVGCSCATLPRADDNAPLCAQCSDVLADSIARAMPITSRWRRRR